MILFTKGAECNEQIIISKIIEVKRPVLFNVSIENLIYRLYQKASLALLFSLTILKVYSI